MKRRTAKGLKRLDIVTLFPAMFDGPLSESLIGKARAKGLIEVRLWPLRDYSDDPKHHKVDDRPYGGGPGMVIQAEPIYRALQAVRKKNPAGAAKPYVVYLSPQGRVLTQEIAAELSKKPWVIAVCGHYEGVDERILSSVDDEISIGDYVLTGGEIPAMVLADTVIRLLPGVVKEEGSIARDSHQDGLLDYPHYTRPAVWRGKKVPEVLMSGNHAVIEAWRVEQSKRATKKKRPDLAQRLKETVP
jgi:tRNA (guanine37-N1)-methyltransferase